MGAKIRKLSLTCTTNGKHTGSWNKIKGRRSSHYSGMAIDVGLINGHRPSASDSLLQMAMDSVVNIRENFGPKFSHV